MMIDYGEDFKVFSVIFMCQNKKQGYRNVILINYYMSEYWFIFDIKNMIK